MHGWQGSGLVIAAALAFQVDAALAQPGDAVDAAVAEGVQEQQPAPAAGAAVVPPDAAPLRVVAAGSPPFVVGKDRQQGLALEIWQMVAGDLGREFAISPAATVEEMIDQVASGRADVAVGPISITAERAERVAFSQPFFQSRLSIASIPKGSWLSRVRPFLTVGFLSGIGGLLLVLMVVGTLMWLAERRANSDEFPQRPGPGIGNGLWMALVTMTTVGYGDRVPRTVAGRIVTGAWMLLSMLIAGSLIAFMSTALAMSQVRGELIEEASDLRDRRVAVVPGTISERFARRTGARPVEARSLPTAAQLVADGAADALIFDRPAVQHYLRENPQSKLALSAAGYEPAGYGFAVRQGSELRQEIDVALLRLQGSGQLSRTIEDWLGEH